MQEDLNVQCYSGLHFWLVIFIGGPGLLLFALGVPVASAVFLRVMHRHLESERFSLRYGFIYEGAKGPNMESVPLNPLLLACKGRP